MVFNFCPWRGGGGGVGGGGGGGGGGAGASSFGFEQNISDRLSTRRIVSKALYGIAVLSNTRSRIS